MNFEELYKPYANLTAPNVAEQIPWLLKQGISQSVADQTLLTVYTEIEKGKTFKDARELWMYLKSVGIELQKKESETHLKNLETFHANLSNTIDAEWNKLGKFQKIWEVIRGRA